MFARLACSLVLVTAFAGTAAAQTSRLMGFVSYPNRAQLGRTAVLEVTLEDVTTDGAPSVITSTRIPKPGSGPIMVALEYDPARIVPAGRYAVRAHIKDGATTLFESPMPVRVLTQGTGSTASITLVEPESKPAAAPAPATVEVPKVEAPKPEPKKEAPKAESPKPEPKREEPKAEAPKSAAETNARGAISAVAAVAAASNVEAPKPEPKKEAPKVEAPKPEPKKEAPKVEAPKPEPKKEAPKVEAPKPEPKKEAPKVEAPKPEPKKEAPKVEAPKPEPKKEAPKVEAPKPTPTPKPAPPPAPVAEAPKAPVVSSSAAAPLGLGATEWTMVEIDGNLVRPADKTHRKIVLAFDESRGTFAGTSGCNDLAGKFHVENSKLMLLSNKDLKICRVDQRTERGFRGVINDTRGYRVTGTTLELLDDKGKRLATLKKQ